MQVYRFGFSAPMLFLLALAGPGLFGEIKVVPDRASGVYQPGERAIWTITAGEGDPAALVYTVKRDGGVLISEGAVDLSKGSATVSATRTDAGALLASFVSGENRDKVLAAGGAIFAPERIRAAGPEPEDFDAFWRAKLAELAAVPINPRLEKTEGVKNAAGVDYYKVTLDNIRGTSVRGQLARPAGEGGKYPAIITYQFAGLYPLWTDTVVNDAKAGWLALNISAHDLPIDETRGFYDALAKGPLEHYPLIGAEDRERSYFLRMFLGCARAVDYLASRSDWDGRTLLVTGGSQGGLQAFVAAALSDKVTGVVVSMPAGCDNLAPLAERGIGWPFWLAGKGPKLDLKKVAVTAGYYDGVNFAARIRCPALVGYGLIDTISFPTGVAAAVNRLQGPREVVVLPLSGHQGSGAVKKAYSDRATAWKKAALGGAALPPPAN